MAAAAEPESLGKDFRPKHYVSLHLLPPLLIILDGGQREFLIDLHDLLNLICIHIFTSPPTSSNISVVLVHLSATTPHHA